MKKRIISVVLVLSTLCVAFAANAKTMNFKDVSNTDWFYDAVKYAYDNSVMQGVETDLFAPNHNLTRGMAVTVLSRVNGADLSGYTTSSFNDVDINRYYGKHIEWAKQNGIVKGMTDSLFEPDEYVTREQVCVMLSNYFDLCNLTTRNTECQSFADESEISQWAKAAVIRMQRGQIVIGKENNNFCPKVNMTRAELAQIINNTNLANLTK